MPKRSPYADLTEAEAMEAVGRSTQAIREKQDDIKALAAIRRDQMARLRDLGVTYKAIAKAAKVTDQVVYKALGDQIAAARSINCPTCSTLFDPVRTRLCPTCHPAHD